MEAIERRKHQMLFNQSKQTNAHEHDEDCLQSGEMKTVSVVQTEVCN